MKATRPTLVLPNKSTSSPPQVTTEIMDSIDPDRISQLSRRKLRGSASEKDNLRRIVLIQNSLVSISPIASPSRSYPEPDELLIVACSNSDDSGIVKSDRRFGETGSTTPASSNNNTASLSSWLPYDEDGYGYVFPDPSIWGSGSSTSDNSDANEEEIVDEDDDELVLVGESDWLDAVLSDLGDEDEYDEESHAQEEECYSSSFHSPYSVRYQSHSPARVPLPLPPSLPLPSYERLQTSPSDFDDDADALPTLDHDEGSSVYSDESLSELATPVSHSSLLCSAVGSSGSSLSNIDNNHHSTTRGVSIQTQRINVVPHSRHTEFPQSQADEDASPPEADSPLSADVSSIIIKSAHHHQNRSGAKDETSSPLSHFRQHHHHYHLFSQRQQHQQHFRPDYFSCHYSRGSSDSF